jgi:hypothetical protein
MHPISLNVPYILEVARVSFWTNSTRLLSTYEYVPWKQIRIVMADKRIKESDFRRLMIMYTTPEKGTVILFACIYYFLLI